MDIKMIVKVLAVIAVAFLVYKLWEGISKGSLVIPMPYKKAEKYMNSAEGYEYDMEADVDADDNDMLVDDVYGDEVVYYESDEEDDHNEDMEDDDGEVYIDDSDMMINEDPEDEPYDDMMDAENSVPKIMQPVMPLLTPSSQLLPKPSPEGADFAQFAPKNLQAQNFLTATQWIGVNTQGSSLKNANYDLRADPIIPKADVGPWQMSSIDPNIYQRPLFG